MAFLAVSDCLVSYSDDKTRGKISSGMRQRHGSNRTITPTVVSGLHNVTWITSFSFFYTFKYVPLARMASTREHQ